MTIKNKTYFTVKAVTPEGSCDYFTYTNLVKAFAKAANIASNIKYKNVYMEVNNIAMYTVK